MTLPNPTVEEKLSSYPAAARKRLQQLRSLILETAEETPASGRVEETLKWGQLSFITTAPKTGSTLRIDATGDAGTTALYVHCATNLADQFRQHYGSELNVIDKRKVEFPADQPLPIDALKHCVALALTYHTRKKS